MSSMEPTPEFSRPFMVDRLGKRPADEALVATPEERARLAKRFGLIGLDSLTAAVRLSRRTGDIIHVEGRLQADVVQECVVTLAPFPSHVEDGFELDFGSDTPDFVRKSSWTWSSSPPSQSRTASSIWGNSSRSTFHWRWIHIRALPVPSSTFSRRRSRRPSVLRSRYWRR